MPYIIGKRSYGRETYPERPAGGGCDCPTGPTGPEGPVVFATGATPNKAMPAETTVADGDLACAVGILVAPAASSPNGGYIGVRVDGVSVTVGDGTSVGVPCYFSGDGGTTARALRDVIVGDLLYWNGSVAGYQLLAGTDEIDFDYPVAA